MTFRRRAGSSYQLPDASFRRLRPGPAADPIDDSFPEDVASSGELGGYVGPQGPVFDGLLLKDLESVLEGIVNPGGRREKTVVITTNTAGPRPPITRLLKPRPSAAPSLLVAIVDSVPQVFQNVAAANA